MIATPQAPHGATPTPPRDANIAQRRGNIEARFCGATHADIAADLVNYAHRGGRGLYLELAKAIWPVAYSFFVSIRDGQPSADFAHLEVQSVYRLTWEQPHGRTAPHFPPAPQLAPQGTAVGQAVPSIEGGAAVASATPTAEPLTAVLWPSGQIAKRAGIGWGNYPIIPGGRDANGSKITWSVNGEGEGRRSIIPTCPAHNSLIRKCNQIIVEAESATLRVLTMTSIEAQRTKNRWKRRASVRYLAIPQLFGRVVMIHSEATEGGQELGEMCEGYGKAQLYELVRKWIEGKPNGARVQPCQNWGKRYKLAKGHNEESKAAAVQAAGNVTSGKAGAKFSMTLTISPKTASNVLNTTTNESGIGVDSVNSILQDVETIIDLGLHKPLTAGQLATITQLEGKLHQLGTYKEDSTMCLSSESPEEGAAAEPMPTAVPFSPSLSANKANQRNKPQKSLEEGAAELLERIIAELFSTAVLCEVQPC